MAIDSDDRKFSALNIGNPWRGVNSIPSGALDTAEIQSLAYLYTEIEIGAAQEQQPVLGGSSSSHIGASKLGGRFSTVSRLGGKLRHGFLG